MKITDVDYELAERFPLKPSIYGSGMSPGDAKVSPAQLERLLKLKLIKLSPSSESSGGMCGQDGLKNPGKGFGRRATTFLRNYEKRPK